VPRVFPTPADLGAQLSKSEKGGVAETSLDSLTHVLSRVALHMATLVPDDKRVDRLVFRPEDARTLMVQIKSATLGPGDHNLSIAVVSHTTAR